MDLQRKVYETQSEKKKDFAIGAGVFISLNVLLFILSTAISALFMMPSANSASDAAAALALLGICLFYVIPFLINIGVLIYFMLTRTWIAIGMLGTFGFLLISALILGVIASIVCFATINSRL
jgi:hypothetical protein